MKAGARDGPNIRQLAEDEEAQNADPQQLRVGERRQHRGIAITIGEHDDPLADRRSNADEDAEPDGAPGRRDPDEWHHDGQEGNARERGISHRGEDGLPAAYHARQDQRSSPAERRDDREERGDVKCVRARPQDNRDADEAERGCEPAAQADLLAQEDDRQRSDEQRRNKAGRRSFRDGEEAQAGDEEQRGAEQSCAAHQLKAEPLGTHRIERRGRKHHRREHQREGQEADPGDLDRRQARRKVFRGDVGATEEHGRQQDQRNAFEGMVDARRCAACSLLPLWHRHGNTVEPCGCGGRRCHGWNSGKCESYEPIKTPIARGSQRPKTGSRYALMGTCVNAPLIKCAFLHYSIGRLRGLLPRGNAASSAVMSSLLNTRSPLAAFSPACSADDAFGIANTVVARVRKLSAT